MQKFISPLTWPGGKSKQWNLIKRYLPKEISIWVEPFFGGGSVGLNAMRDKVAKKYFFSDINSHLINFWKNLANKTNTEYLLSEEVEKYFYPNIQNVKDHNLSELNWMNYFLKNNLTFNGQERGSFSQLRLEQNLNLAKLQRLRDCHELLSNENIRKQISIKNFFEYNEPEILFNYFFYLDPTYLKNKGKVYTNNLEGKWDKFWETVKQLDANGASILISLDDCPENREEAKKLSFNIYEEHWKYTSTNTKKAAVRDGNELFLTNYEVKNNATRTIK